MTWPDGGATPFRGEKNTNWEGAYRVPFLIRWPGVIKPGTEVNGIAAHEDWVPTLGAAAGVPDIKEQLLTGYKAGDATYKVHLDGYNLMPYLKGETADDPRREFLYWTDDGELACLRYDKWKLVFMEQRAHGLDVWDEPFWTLRAPKLIDLHSDPSNSQRQRPRPSLTRTPEAVNISTRRVSRRTQKKLPRRSKLRVLSNRS